MFRIKGNNVAGAGSLEPEMQAQGVPSHWSSYVKHDDVDAVAAKAGAAGGQVLFPPLDVMEEGRMTMVQDPSGAVFGVWQPRNHTGAELVNQANTLVWNELQTRDVEAARKFYGDVFGWQYEVDDQGYVACYLDGRVHAGMIPMDETWGEHIPPNWAVYILVEDIQATVARVKELQGTVAVPPTPAGEMGEFAVIQDPQGAALTVMEFQGPADPPPGY
jgi:predicted enzyme related to lactoylglutathione lyase